MKEKMKKYTPMNSLVVQSKAQSRKTILVHSKTVFAVSLYRTIGTGTKNTGQHSTVCIIIYFLNTLKVKV